MPASAGDAGRPLSDITDPGLAEAGRARIEWAQRGMPVLRLISERFAAARPFTGLTVAACLHVTAETAGLVNALRAGRGSSSPPRTRCPPRTTSRRRSPPAVRPPFSPGPGWTG